MTFTPDQVAMLEAPLNSAVVKRPTDKFGPKGDYIEAWHAINEANRIFGFDAWSYAIALTQDSLAQVEVEKTDYKTKAKYKEMQWQAAYTCVGTLTVASVTRQDVGFGSGFAKGIGDAIEGATKEAATDALKRCLRTFGNPFGLALYDKSRANVAEAEPESVKRLRATMKACTSINELTGWLKGHKALLDDLSTNDRERLEDEYVAFREALKVAQATVS